MIIGLYFDYNFTGVCFRFPGRESRRCVTKPLYTFSKSGIDIIKTTGMVIDI